MSRKRLLAIALAGAMCLTVPAANAGVAVKSTDTGSFPVLRVSVLTSEPSSRAPSLRENGLPVRIDRAENLGAEKSVVLAIDRSQSMRGAPLANAIAAARGFLAAKPAADRLAVASFATKPMMLTDFSTERSDLDGALRAIEVDPVQGTTLYDAIVRASNQLASEPLQARVIIAVTDGNETRSSASLTDAISAARKAETAIYVVAIESPKFNPSPLRKLAKDTGGAYHGTASSATLGAEYAAIASELRRTWRLDYATAARPGETVFLEARGTPRSPLPRRSRCRRASVPARTTRSRLSLLPGFLYKTVLGTQMMAIVTFFIVLLGASIALTTVKGARLKKRLAPHLAKELAPQKRKREPEAPRSRGRAVRRDRDRVRRLEVLEAARSPRREERPADPHGRALLPDVRKRARRRSPGDGQSVDVDHVCGVRRRRLRSRLVRLVQGEPAAQRRSRTSCPTS